ncbi:MAG: glycosyltransferase [Methylocystaceae bacterium]|nr:glycosyltransferase [Methylocystaceae bacterium]
MKLLILAQGYPSPASPIAGIYHQIQFQEFAKTGADITVVIPTPYVPKGLDKVSSKWRSYKEAPYEQFDGSIRILRPRYFALPRENKFFLPDIAQTIAIRKLGLDKPDVILAFFALPTGAVAQNLSKQWKVPYVLSLLGDDVTVYPYLNKRNKRLFSKVMQNASHVITNSNALLREAKEISGVTGEWLSIGINFSKFESLPSREECRKILNLPTDQFLLGYIGNLIEAKGILELQNAIKTIDNSTLTTVFVGNGPLFHKIAKQQNVICVGAQPYNKIPLYMMAIDMIILPSNTEGLGMVLVEAAVTGIPCLGSDTGGISDLLKEDRGFLFPVKNSTELASQIQYARMNPAERDKRKRKLESFVRQNQNVITNSKKLMDICCRVIKK